MELLDLVDEKGCPTGGQVDRAAVHRDGLRHRTAHVWLLRNRDGKPQVLLQKRSPEKDSFPGCLDTSSAGHIPAGCDPVSSALRELREELGVDATAKDLTSIGCFDIRYEMMFHESLFRDNEVAFVYVLHLDRPAEDFVIQREELESVVWQDFDGVCSAVSRHDPAYCVPSGSLALLRDWLHDRVASQQCT